MGYSNKFHFAKRYKWTTYTLDFIKDMLIKRRDNEKDNIILISGSRGDGKSTLTGKILFKFEDFDPYESIVYTKEAFFKQLKKKKGYIWADEGIISTAKGNTMSRANKLLFEAFTINRNNFNTVFILLPSVEDFDSKILQYCSGWIHIDRRGLGVMLLPQNKGLFGKKNWDIDRMKKIYDEFMKESKDETSMPYWVYDNFVGYIRFGRLTLQQQNIVDEIKELRKNENLDREFKEVEIEVKDLENYNKYSAKKISELIIKGELRSIEQFRATCEEMKLNPEEQLKKCDSILKRNALKSVKGMFKEYSKKDSLINF